VALKKEEGLAALVPLELAFSVAARARNFVAQIVLHVSRLRLDVKKGRDGFRAFQRQIYLL
jgi:hypothetical protein